MRINLSDVTFLVPIRVDSINRLENILLSINSLLVNFDTNIRVLEADKYNNHFLERLLPPGVVYTFVEDWDPIFHRTKYINVLFSGAHTPLISIWDADVIISCKQIIQTVEALRSGTYEVSFPYDGTFFDVPEVVRDLYVETQDFTVLENSMSKFSLPYGKSMGGGAVFITADAFIKSGKEDERFYGWGPEDWNRVEKWKLLGYKTYRPDGPLFHLTHPRDINGFHSWDGQKMHSFYILEQTKNSLPSEL